MLGVEAGYRLVRCTETRKPGDDPRAGERGAPKLTQAHSSFTSLFGAGCSVIETETDSVKSESEAERPPAISVKGSSTEAGLAVNELRCVTSLTASITPRGSVPFKRSQSAARNMRMVLGQR